MHSSTFAEKILGLIYVYIPYIKKVQICFKKTTCIYASSIKNFRCLQNLNQQEIYTLKIKYQKIIYEAFHWPFYVMYASNTKYCFDCLIPY